MQTGNWMAKRREENDMTKGLGAFHRLTFTCSILALAIAAPAIAAETDDSKKAADTQKDENSEKAEENAPPRQRVFQESDTDGDGRLSKEERVAAREKHHQKFIDEFDADGDGKLSDSEKETARKQRNARQI
jgi:hypothetical protein